MKVTVRPIVLKGWRIRKGLPLEAVVAKTKIEESEISHWETHRSEISVADLKKIAKFYRLSWTAFLLDELPPSKKDPVNHRRRPDAKDFSPETLQAFTRARHILEFASDIGLVKENKLTERFPTAITHNPELVASKVRSYIETPFDHQLKWRNANVAKRKWIDILEREGIYIAEMDMPEVEARGFSLKESGRDIIVLSKNDSVNGRIFSLFHEVAHLLLKKSGVCDMYEGNGPDQRVDRTEVFCNAFAGAFLLPSQSFLNDSLVISAIREKNFSDSVLQYLGKRFNVSAAVVLRRLNNFGYISSQEYKRRYTDEQDMYVESEEKNKKGFARHEYKVINQNGRAFTSEVITAYASNIITAHDVSNYLNTTVRSISRIEQALSK